MYLIVLSPLKSPLICKLGFHYYIIIVELALVDILLSQTLFCFLLREKECCVALYYTVLYHTVPVPRRTSSALVSTRNKQPHTHDTQSQAKPDTHPQQSSTDATLLQIGESCNLENQPPFYSSSSLSSKALSGPALHLTLTHIPLTHIKARSSVYFEILSLQRTTSIFLQHLTMFVSLL